MPALSRWPSAPRRRSPQGSIRRRCDTAHALATGHVTATALVKAYLACIEAYDRDEPKLNAVRALNPDGVRRHARDRHARRLFVPGRSGEEPLCAAR
ncbi:protein of unknown function [Bradyrhizobium vignae]|uniref:Amidase domain-containing protein n=1 Tax=Bradyrhizobium vignae TaxID=1549949 RepID=A0A2U3Q4Q0_9BRAD|nr:protein of unknown function [Bradyrhizobium vignae]